jgi:hypothetical protein
VVITSSDDRYEVRSPDMAWVLRNRLFIALTPKQGETHDRVADLTLLHVVGVEELHETADR